MNKIACLAGLYILACIPVNAQDAEWNTYFGELHEFQVQYPTEWVNGSGDKEKAASMVILFDPKEGSTGIIVMTMQCAYALGKDMSAKESVLKKTAKKSKDAYFKITGEGDMRISDEKCKWIEYTSTSKSEDGTETKQTTRDYIFHHRSKGRFISDLFTIRMYAKSENWASMLPVLEKIRDSFKFVEPAK